MCAERRLPKGNYWDDLRTTSSILDRFGLVSPAKCVLSQQSSQYVGVLDSKYSSDIVSRVNYALINEGLAEKPLTKSEIVAIVDLHSPTAGDLRKERCLDFSKLLKGSLTNFELVHFETYNHCYKATSRSLSE